MSASQGRNAEELKSLVLQTLETNGVLGQIRAQLRANVYKAIDCDDEQVAAEPSKAKLTKSPVGKLMAEIVAEFFEFYQFRHSLSVFLPESNLGKDRRNRAEVAFDAGLVRVGTETSILEQLTGLAAGSGPHKGGEGWHSSASSTTASSPPPQIAASLASTARHSAASAVESSVPSSGSETPPAGPPLPGGLGSSDRNRVGGMGSGGAAAVVDTIRSVVTSGGGPRLHAEEKTSPEAALKPEEEQKEEGSRRKPLGKLPSLSGGGGSPIASSSGGGGKDLLPALRSSGLQPLGASSAVAASSGGYGGNSPGSGKSGSGEEVMLDDSVGDDQQLEQADRNFDWQIARLNRVAGTGLDSTSSPKEEAPRGQRSSCKVPSAAAAAGGVLGMDGLGSRILKPAEAASSPAGARSSSRSPESSPERSASPGGGSPAASSASRSGASRSAGSPSEVQEANDRSGMTASASEPGTPSQAGGSAGAKAAVEPFDAEESISIGSDGSGDIDLSGRNGLNSSGEGGSSSLAAGRSKAAPASQDDDDNAVDEVEESISEDSFYVEGYQESEAKDSDNDKF